MISHPDKHPCLSNSQCWRQTAFTLVELLVVIAIIGILAAIIIPVVGRARDSARGLQCLSNLRTLAQAHAMYRNDFKGHGPPGTAQNTHLLSENHKAEGILLLRRYYKPGPNYIFAPGPKFIFEKTEICPMAIPTNSSVKADEPGRIPDYGLQTHGDSAHAIKDENGDQVHAGNFDSFYQVPSRTPLIWDGWNAIWNSSRRMPPRHGGGNGINVAFLDSHTAYLPASDKRLWSEWWSAASTKAQPDDSKLEKGEFLLKKERTSGSTE